MIKVKIVPLSRPMAFTVQEQAPSPIRSFATNAFVLTVLALGWVYVGWQVYYVVTHEPCILTVDQTRAEELLEKNGGPPVHDANGCIPDSYFR